MSVVVFELDVVPGEVAVSSANGKISMEFGARENMQLLWTAYLVAQVPVVVSSRQPKFGGFPPRFPFGCHMLAADGFDTVQGGSAVPVRLMQLGDGWPSTV